MLSRGSRGACATLAGLLALAGGAGPSVAEPPPQPTAGPGQVVVYIYRQAKMLNAGRAATFSIDDVDVVDLGIGGCSVITVPAGRHVVKQKWKAIPLFDYGSRITSKDKMVSVNGDWTPGKTYFYELDVSGGYTAPRVIEVDWQLLEGDPVAGLQRMAHCRYTPARNLDRLPVPGGSATAPASPVSDDSSTNAYVGP